MALSITDANHLTLSKVKVTLQNSDIWNQFHEFGTEMIITKTGRRMFPYMRLEITGLEPEACYFVVFEATLSSGSRYKYSGFEWKSLGLAEPQLPSAARIYIHPDSPAAGQHWMAQPVIFNKLKLTNNTLDRTGNLVLTSMHKYLPRIHVVKASDVLTLQWSPTVTFTFPETEFIAVTAYQNQKVTKLKIDNNPFAKGFRDAGQPRKRKMQHKEGDGSDNSGTYSKEYMKQKSLATVSQRDTSSISLQDSCNVVNHEEDNKIPYQMGQHPPSHLMWPDFQLMSSYCYSQLWPYPYLFHPPNSYISYRPIIPFMIPYKPSPEPYLMDLSVAGTKINAED